MRNEISQAVALLTAEYDIPAFDEARLSMWFYKLSNYPKGTVLKSAHHFIATSKFKPQLSEIIHGCEVQMPDCWLGSDEAWAKMPQSESESSMMTNEISQAMSYATPLIEQGESNAARMAFRDAYNRLVERAKLEGRKPAYFLSSGSDRGGRESVLCDAVKDGLISVESAIKILPECAKHILVISGVTEHALLSNSTSNKNGKEEVKKLLGKLKIKPVKPIGN